MTIAPSAAQTQAPAATHDGCPVLLMHPELRLSPEQFALVCEANPEAVLELAADGQLIRMTPTGGDTGRRNTNLIYQLTHWARSQGGWTVLPQGAEGPSPHGQPQGPAAARGCR